MQSIRLFLFLIAAAGAGSASTANLRVEDAGIDISADTQEIDLKNDLLELGGNVRISQGTTSIEAGRAKASAAALALANSRWTFERAVHIQTAEADLKSDLAVAVFVDGELAAARLTGSPAYFQQLSGEPDKRVSAQAGVVDYDLSKGIVTLTNQVQMMKGGSEFRSDTIIYNYREGRITSENGKVNITIRPRKAPATPEAQRSQPPATKSRESGS